MTNNLYLIFLGIYTLIIMVNYNLLKNPKPYPPENIREEFKRGRERLGSYKYRGLSYYLLPRLVKSESNWINGNNYWYRSGIRLGIMGFALTLFTMLLGEVFKIYDPLVGLFIILIPSILGMIYLCIKMEKDILKD